MATVLEGLNVKYPEFDIKGTIQRLEKLTDIINIPEADFTACHNDLLADNFILIKDIKPIVTKETLQEFQKFANQTTNKYTNKSCI